MTRGNRVVISVGRINPLTRGHQLLIQQLRIQATVLNALPIFFIIDGEKSSKDKVKNPLSGEQRLKIAKTLFSDITFDVVSSAYEALEVLDLQGYKPKIWVCGSDRASNYRKLLASEKLECGIYELNREAGEAVGVSATKARQAARDSDMESFASFMPAMSKESLMEIACYIRGEEYDFRVRWT